MLIDPNLVSCASLSFWMSLYLSSCQVSLWSYPDCAAHQLWTSVANSSTLVEDATVTEEMGDRSLIKPTRLHSIVASLCPATAVYHRCHRLSASCLRSRIPIGHCCRLAVHFAFSCNIDWSWSTACIENSYQYNSLSILATVGKITDEFNAVLEMVRVQSPPPPT